MMTELGAIYVLPDAPQPDDDQAPALLTFDEMDYVTETSTGLLFRENTPLAVVGRLITRLTRQHKRIEWSIGDALNFAERTYGDTYTAWVHETGLNENTLATIKWVAGAVPSSRRREDVGWSHHRDVAGLSDPAEQTRLLDLAADQGMTRFELREEVKAAKKRAAAPESVCAADQPPVYTVNDLLPEWKARALASGQPRGYVQALVDTASESCFRPGAWRD